MPHSALHINDDQLSDSQSSNHRYKRQYREPIANLRHKADQPLRLSEDSTPNDTNGETCVSATAYNRNLIAAEKSDTHRKLLE